LKETAFFTQYVVAPFGLPANSGAHPGAVDSFTNIYHSWEESVSRILYNARGVADSSIAASMHEYVDKHQDQDVVRTMRRAADDIGQLLQGAAVVELPEGLTAARVADMLVNLATLYRAAFAGAADTYTGGALSSSSSSGAPPLSVTHESTGEAVNLALPVRPFNAHDVLASSDTSLINADFLRQLLAVLLPASDTGGVSADRHIGADLHAAPSAMQFGAMLDVFCESPEVSAALLGPLGLPAGGCLGLLCLRCGVGGWFPLAQPTSSYVALADELVGRSYRAARKVLEEQGETGSAHWSRANGEPVATASQTARAAATDTEEEEGSDWEDCSDSDSTGNISEAEDPHRRRPRRGGLEGSAEPPTQGRAEANAVGATEAGSRAGLRAAGEDQLQEAFAALCQTLDANTNTGLGTEAGAASAAPTAAAIDEDEEDDFDAFEEAEDECLDNYHRSPGDSGTEHEESGDDDFGEAEDESWAPPGDSGAGVSTRPWLEVPLDSGAEALFDASCATARAVAQLSQAAETVKAEADRRAQAPAQELRRWPGADSDSDGDSDSDMDDDDDDDDYEQREERQSDKRLRGALKTLNAANLDAALLPTSVCTGILVCRANCRLQLGRVEDTIVDCDAAVALDPRSAQAYSVRADAKLALLQGDLGEEQECNGDDDSDGAGGEALYDAARDALRAFLLGGSVDLELAAKAEDISREACRAEAKRLYNQRVVRRQRAASLGGSDCMGADAGAARLNPDYLPKPWLVSSYLQGYEPLERGLEIDSGRAEKAHERSVRRQQMEEEAEAKAEEETGVVQVAAASNGQASVSSAHITPPQHLLDLNALEVFRAHDHYCYQLLREAAAALESDRDMTAAAVEEAVEKKSEEVVESSLALGGSACVCEEVEEWAGPEARLVGSDFLDAVGEEGALQFVRVTPSRGCLEVAPGPALADLDGDVPGAETVDELVVSLQQYNTPRSVTEGLSDSGANAEVACSQAFLRTYRLLQGARVPGSGERVLEDLLRVRFDISDHGAVVVTVFPAQYIETPLLSPPLRARLLNIVSSLAFLAGDSIGAAACLRESHAEDPRLLDTHIKLGCLLIDLDELEEASKFLDGARDLDPENPIVSLHLAELRIHEMDYAEAVSLLRAALALLESGEGEAVSRGLYEAPLRDVHCKAQLTANIYSLLGVAQFRANPTAPDVALRVLEKGVARHPSSVYILLCQGEILSQVGEVVRALGCFQRAASVEEGGDSSSSNPLPFINAARTYQQLSQPVAALRHIALALRRDSFLPMTFVDLAQIFVHLGRTQEAVLALDHALVLSRHCSEIRDVLTARTIAQIQLELETQEGICRPKCNAAV